MTDIGLREQKKRQTRQLIADTAARLFAERGFDDVSVAAIARTAQVSEVTVFNYFPTKGDLVFGRMEFVEERLLTAIQERTTGESITTAFGRVLFADLDHLPARAEVIARAAPVIRASPTLQAREREVTDQYTTRLAHALAAETGKSDDDIEAWAVASALMAVHRGLLEHVRTAVLSGQRGAALVGDATEQVRRALARLDVGLAGYPEVAMKGN